MKIKLSIEIDTGDGHPADRFLREQIEKLARTDTNLADAVAAGGNSSTPQGAKNMAKTKAGAAGDPNPILDALAAQIDANTSVVDSAIQFIGGVRGMIDAAVTAALAGGATAAQLAPFTDLSAAMAAKDQALSEAIAANTPAAP